MLRVDHIVIGAGINGSCAAYQLAKTGVSVLLLERFPLPHTRGSSHGPTRGIRRAYPDPFMCKMMDEAYEEWHRIEKLTNTQLIKETGLLVFSDCDKSNLVDSTEFSFRRTPGSKYTTYDPQQFKKTFPYLRMEDNVRGVFDPSGGIIMADKALRAVQDLSLRLGVKIMDGHEVTEVKQNASEVIVKTKQGISATAKSCVICPGPWGKKLMSSMGYNLPLNPIKIPVYYWKADNFLTHTFIYEGEGEHIWGLPPHEYESLAKICLHVGPTTDPDTRDIVDTSHMKSFLEDFIRRRFPGVRPEVIVEESCMYTLTPDSNPIVDVLPGTNNRIVVGLGFSGTGFKHGPVVGRMLAEMAMGKSKRQEADIFKIDRFLDSKL